MGYFDRDAFNKNDDGAAVADEANRSTDNSNTVSRKRVSFLSKTAMDLMEERNLILAEKNYNDKKSDDSTFTSHEDYDHTNVGLNSNKRKKEVYDHRIPSNIVILQRNEKGKDDK